MVQLLPRLIEGFRESHPKVSFYVREGSTAKMASAVASGDLDLAIAMLPCDHPDLACERWFEEPIVVVARPGAQLAGQQAFGTVGIAPRVVMELESIEGIKAHVEAGLGYSALGFHSVERKLAGGQLVALAIRGLEIRRAMGLIYRRHAELSPAVSAFRTALLGLRPRNP